MAKDYITVTKDGISRTVRSNEIYDWQRRGWLAEGAKKPVDAATLEKALVAAKDAAKKSSDELAKTKAELATAQRSIKDLTAEKAALADELAKTKAELAKK